jgi:magnesium transporter
MGGVTPTGPSASTSGTADLAVDARSRAYRDGVVIAEDFPIAEVSVHLAEPDVVVWFDLCAPDVDDLHQLTGELGLHELAVEDVLEEHQRPKLDHYESHLFLVTRVAELDDEKGTLHEYELDAFISSRWLITVRKNARFPIERAMKRWDRTSELAKHGVPYLVYGLLDMVVDEYFDTLQTFDDFYDAVADRIFGDEPLDPAKQRHWFEMRRALVRFHRVVVPMRETISTLMRRETNAVPDDLYPYYQDVYDHILRVSESSDSLRDLVSTIVETNLSLRDYRQNQIMKQVTSWAAIIAVPTLVTGVYGMNVPFPGHDRVWGVFTSTILMLVTAGSLYVLFRKRDWL